MEGTDTLTGRCTGTPICAVIAAPMIVTSLNGLRDTGMLNPTLPPVGIAIPSAPRVRVRVVSVGNHEGGLMSLLEQIDHQQGRAPHTTLPDGPEPH